MAQIRVNNVGPLLGRHKKDLLGLCFEAELITEHNPHCRDDNPPKLPYWQIKGPDFMAVLRREGKHQAADSYGPMSPQLKVTMPQEACQLET